MNGLSLISFAELAQTTETASLARQSLLLKMFEGQNIYPFPMTVIIDRAYVPGAPMKMSFPNGNPCDENRQLETWRLLTRVFPMLQVNEAYHFLCFRDKTDKKRNYYPILLVEEVPLMKAKSRSASLARLAEDDPMRYLTEVEEANLRWLDTFEISEGDK